MCHTSNKNLKFLLGKSDKSDVWDVGHYLKAFHDAKRALAKQQITGEVPGGCKWLRPPLGFLRLDVDACWDVEKGRYAAGGVFWNAEGEPYIAFGIKFEQVQSVIVGELLAIKEGLEIAHSHNLASLQVALDSLKVVRAVTNPKEFPVSVVLLLLISDSGLMRILLPVFMHCNRKANRVAHELAPFSSILTSPFVWEEGDFPTWVLKLVTLDTLS